MSFQQYAGLIPFAIELAKIAEAAIPIPAAGKAKFAFALDAAGDIFETEEDVRAGWQDKTQFTAAVGRAVNTVVNLFNRAGIFKPSAPAPAAVVQPAAAPIAAAVPSPVIESGAVPDGHVPLACP